ncbi:MAG TPA: NADP oxidoreductase, partial [Rhodobacteraceae bacterium]|nr:NADP oxidoreductase [Paracoccaceae bacterium]
MDQEINSIVARHNSDKTRLINILWDTQRHFGHISGKAVDSLSKALGMSTNDIRETASFYHFFHTRPFGKHSVYLCDSVIGRMNGYEDIRAALEREIAAPFGSVDAEGIFGLGDTNCIGLSDQEPAMMVDDVVFTRLTPAKVAEIIGALKAGKTPVQIANPDGFDSRSAAYVDAIVEDNIRQKGPVLFKEGRDYKALLQQVLDEIPDELIDEITLSNIRGRGGAGFPTGLKWRL